jgi:metal-responsive CopG/Arc/MetJ family transcriptional regulator
VKTAISIPDTVFQAAEQLARRLGKSRSELYSEALAVYIEQHRTKDVTERLNAVYEAEPSELDPVLQLLQLRSLPKDDW